MKRYDSYKDSGVGWIGEVPSHWEICRVKHKYQLQTGFTPTSGNSSFYEQGGNGHTWVTIADMKSKFVSASAKDISDEAIKHYNPQITTRGALLYSFKLSVGQVAFAAADVYTNEAIASFLNNEKVCLPFWYYASQFFVEFNANTNIYGAHILNQELIKNAIIVFPPLYEQQAIASYLDKRCGEIDRAIAKQQKRIELLQELRQNIITNAVTRGINPDAPLKDSGVEWIGQVPEHWEIMMLKRCATIKTGCTPPTKELKYYENEDIDWFTPGDIGDDNVSEAAKKISNIAKKDGVCRIFPSHIVYFVGIGATIGKVSYCNIEASANQQINAIIPNHRGDYRFLTYCLKSQKEEIFLTANTVTLPIINQERTGSLLIPVPPLSEQHQIVDHIEKQTVCLDKSIAKAELRIGLLQELKQSIITEVVIGKIKVC